MPSFSRRKLQVGRVTVGHPFLLVRLLIAAVLFAIGLYFLLGPFLSLILLASMSAFSRFGVLIGGLLTLLLPVAAIAYSYYSSRDAYLSQTESISTDQARELYAFVEAEADRLDISAPELRFQETGAVNAFAFGRRANSFIILTDGLLVTLDEDELEAVIAHELAHIYNRDSVLLSILVGFQRLTAAILTRIGYSLRVGIYQHRGVVLTPAEKEAVKHNVRRRTKFLTAPLSLSRLSVSRYREYIADATAAEMTSPESMQSALASIGANQTDDATHDMPAALCIYSTVGGFLSTLRSDHPPIEKRIERLEKLK